MLIMTILIGKNCWNQLTVDEMANMIAMAGYQTAAMDSVGKVATLDFDGPAAINNNFTGVGSIGFPIEVMVASTWNKELAQAWGECMGKMAGNGCCGMVCTRYEYS